MSDLWPVTGRSSRWQPDLPALSPGNIRAWAHVLSPTSAVVDLDLTVRGDLVIFRGEQHRYVSPQKLEQFFASCATKRDEFLHPSEKHFVSFLKINPSGAGSITTGVAEVFGGCNVYQPRGVPLHVGAHAAYNHLHGREFQFQWNGIRYVSELTGRYLRLSTA